MAKIRPSSTLSLMPTDDVINHSLRYLRSSQDDQAERSRVVLLPLGGWGDCGFSIGGGVNALDFPDNSILFLSIRRDAAPSIVLPPPNSLVESAGGSFPSVDNGVIEHLVRMVGSSCSFSADEQEENPSLLSLPMAIETSKMRRRGIPLCTPIIIGIPDGGWGDLPSILWEMMDGFGLGAIIHSRDMTIPMTNDGGRIIRSAVMSMVPRFFERAMGIIMPDGDPDLLPVEMFHRLAWEMGASPRLISESKSADDGGMWVHQSFGVSESGHVPGPVRVEDHGSFWESLGLALSGKDVDEVPDVGDVILELRADGIEKRVSPDDGSVSTLRDAMMGIGASDVITPPSGRAVSGVEVRVHHDRREVPDPSRFRPRPGSSAVLEMLGGESRLIVFPHDIRRARMDLTGVHPSEIVRITSFSVQTLSTLWCLLFDDIPGGDDDVDVPG